MLSSLKRLGVVGSTIQVELKEQNECVVVPSLCLCFVFCCAFVDIDRFIRFSTRSRSVVRTWSFAITLSARPRLKINKITIVQMVYALDKAVSLLKRDPIVFPRSRHVSQSMRKTHMNICWTYSKFISFVFALHMRLLCCVVLKLFGINSEWPARWHRRFLSCFEALIPLSSIHCSPATHEWALFVVLEVPWSSRADSKKGSILTIDNDKKIRN